MMIQMEGAEQVRGVVRHGTHDLATRPALSGSSPGFPPTGIAAQTKEKGSGCKPESDNQIKDDRRTGKTPVSPYRLRRRP